MLSLKNVDNSTDKSVILGFIASMDPQFSVNEERL